jgi:hypothetical protein
MTFDPRKELEDREEFEKKQAADHMAMETLIRSSNEKSLTLEHNGINIRIRSALPAPVRREALALARKYNGIDVAKLKRGQINMIDLPDGFIEASLLQLYRSLAALCIDAPYNNPESWKYYDEKTGEVELVYQKAEAVMEEAHKAAISFRKESPGPSTD